MSLLDQITDNTLVLIEIIPVDNTYETLHYSTRANTISKNGTYITVLPYITKTLNLSVSSVLPFMVGEVPRRKSIDGFQLLYNIGVTYDVPRYYGATVNCYIGSTDYTDFSQYYQFYTGIISNVTLDVNSTYVTVSTNELNLKKNILEEYDNRAVPILAGHSTNFGAVPVNINDNIYHVVASHPMTIHNVYDANDDLVPYTLIPFRNWTVVRCDSPADSKIRVHGENGNGTVGDLLVILLAQFGFDCEPADIAIMNNVFSENTALQLFEQTTFHNLITEILHSTTHMWYLDLVTGKIRIKPFYRTTSTAEITDNFIVAANNTMSYRKRPYTHFHIIYDIDFSSGKYKEHNIEHPLAAQYDQILHKKYPTVFALTSNSALALAYLNEILNLYGSGLGQLPIEINLYGAIPEIGDTITVNSEFLKLDNKTFIVEGITYKFTTMTIILYLVTI